MRLLICSDTHLGKSNFKSDIRKLDFFDSFKQIIDYALNKDNNIGAIIHSGDFFDVSLPDVDVLVNSVNQLMRLKKEDIPFFVNAGNHDVGTKGSFIKVLDRLELVINLSNKKNYVNKDGKIFVKGVVFKDIFISSIMARDNDINRILNILEPEIHKDKFNIFCFHHFIEDLNPLFTHINKNSLPKGFNLYVSGHYHKRFETRVFDKPLLYPGSTERWDFSEMNDEKGFFVFDTISNNYEFVKLKLRKAIIHSLNCNNLSPIEINEKMESLIKDGNNMMLFFVLKGKLKSGVKSEINRGNIIRLAREHNFLLCNIYFSELVNPNNKQVSVSDRSLSEIENEFFKNKGLSNKEVKFVRELINIVGFQDYDDKDIIKLIDESDIF